MANLKVFLNEQLTKEDMLQASMQIVPDYEPKYVKNWKSESIEKKMHLVDRICKKCLGIHSEHWDSCFYCKCGDFWYKV